MSEHSSEYRYKYSRNHCYPCLHYSTSFCIVPIVLLYTAQQSIAYPIFALGMDDLVHDALVRIKEADSVGADTTDLTARMNDALNLIEEAERGGAPSSCISRDECLARAAEMLNSIARDAVTLHEQKSRENTDRFYLNMLVYAPIGAIASSAASVIIYTNLKGYMQARMMEMDVREVKEE